MKGLFAQRSATRPLVLVAVLAAALVAASAGAGAPPSLKQQEASKKAQAAAVLVEVAQLDVELNRADEALNGARYRLSQLRTSEAQTRGQLALAQAQYRIAERHAAARLVAVYESSEPTTVDAILGATSVGAMLDRFEAVDATTAMDRQIATRLIATRMHLRNQAHRLESQRQQQAVAVADLRRSGATIRTGLAKQQLLLSGIKAEVAQIQARERVQQQQLLALARARLAAEALARAQAAAEARRRAAAAAAAAAAQAAAQKAAAAQATTTTAASPTTTSQATTTLPATTTAVTPDAGTPTTIVTTTAALPSQPLPGGHPEAATVALKYLGVPYVWGGSTPAGLDCSGLVMIVYGQLGISLPHYAAAQFGFGTPVPRDQLQAGDLVFFDGLDHVGIWIGGNEFVDAPHTGASVKIETFAGWYTAHFVGARRL